jgi:hypothetical protein
MAKLRDRIIEFAGLYYEMTIMQLGSCGGFRSGELAIQTLIAEIIRKADNAIAVIYLIILLPPLRRIYFDKNLHRDRFNKQKGDSLSSRKDHNQL